VNTYTIAVTQPRKMLANLLTWLDKAVAHADARGFSPEVYVESRLRPDMFPLRRQIQSACDTAKFLAARLSGVEAPRHPDDEATLAELQGRIQQTIDYLDGFQPEAFVDASDRRVEVPALPQGSWVRGEDYTIEFAVPNLVFHLTTTYAILRYNGVDLGKRDFIGAMSIRS